MGGDSSAPIICACLSFCLTKVISQVFDSTTTSAMVFSCYNSDTVRFINKEGIELFQIGKDKTGSGTYDTVYIKDNNSVAVSSEGRGERCITIIDIESKKVMKNCNRRIPFYHLEVKNIL
jgi:hypothetical protein